MTYNVKNSVGEIVTSIPDRHIDRESTSLALLGFNATDYGLDHAENFVRLMEHFANDLPPENPITGQLWYDTSAGALRVYRNDQWAAISGIPSTGGDHTEGGISGVFHSPIDTTSVALIVAGGEIVAVVANQDISLARIPETVNVETFPMVLRDRFPHGFKGGVNLANTNGDSEPSDFVFNGRVPVAQQSHFAGGGADTPRISGWGYVDLGAGKSIGLMVSNGLVVAASSSTHVLRSELPEMITFFVRKTSDADGDGIRTLVGGDEHPVTCALRSRFPAQVYHQWVVTDGVPSYNPAQSITNVALFPGLTFAGASASGNNSAMYDIIRSVIARNDNAVASAQTELRAWVDANSATAMKVTQLEATFMSETGTSSVANAIQSLIARASDTGAITSAITSLKTEFTSALGTASFAQALTKLNASSTATQANASEITSLKSTFVDKFGGTNIAEAVNNLYTIASSNPETPALAGWTLSLNSNGYVTGVEALNGGASNNYFKVRTSNFIIGDNNLDFIPFEIKNGVVYMKNAAIENLSIGGNKLMPGLAGVYQFTGPDITVGNSGQEHIAIETPPFAIGDSVSGSAIAFLSFIYDGSMQVDTGIGVKIYLDYGNGTGYHQVKYFGRMGIRTNNGDTIFVLPCMIPVTFSSTTPCRIKIGVLSAQMTTSTSRRTSGFRAIEINVFKVTR